MAAGCIVHGVVTTYLQSGVGWLLMVLLCWWYTYLCLGLSLLQGLPDDAEEADIYQLFEGMTCSTHLQQLHLWVAYNSFWLPDCRRSIPPCLMVYFIASSSGSPAMPSQVCPLLPSYGASSTGLLLTLSVL